MVSVMMKNNIAADNFIPIMNSRLLMDVVMLLFFTRNPKLFQRWNLFWPKGKAKRLDCSPGI